MYLIYAIYRYFLPDDGDDEHHPNIYTIKHTSNTISLKQLKQSFPLSGEYIFRVQTVCNSMNVWLDVGSGNYNDNEVMMPIEDINTGLLLKVTRICSIVSNDSFSPTGTKTTTSSTVKSATVSATNSAAREPTMTPIEPILQQELLSDDTLSPVHLIHKTANSSATTDKPPAATRRPSEKLIRFEDDASPASTTTSTKGNDDFFGLSSTTNNNTNSNGNNSNSNSNADIFGAFSNPTPTPTAANTTNASNFDAFSNNNDVFSTFTNTNTNTINRPHSATPPSQNMNPMTGGLGGGMSGNIGANNMGGVNVNKNPLNSHTNPMLQGRNNSNSSNNNSNSATFGDLNNWKM